MLTYVGFVGVVVASGLVFPLADSPDLLQQDEEVALAEEISYEETPQRATDCVPIILGSILTSGPGATSFASTIEIAGDYAFMNGGTVAGATSDFLVVDVSDPTDLAKVIALNVPGRVWDIEIQSGFAYVATAEGGLVILDINEPTVPVQIASFDTPGFADHIGVGNGFAYVSCRDNTIQVFDIDVILLSPGLKNR